MSDEQRLTNPLAVALDTDDLDAAAGLAARLAGRVGMVKVGLELYSAHGPSALTVLAEHAPVFLDLKLHDIPTTVQRAASVLAGTGVAMLTVHASGGSAMVAAAVAGARAGAERARKVPPLVVAVTVLTSLGDDELDDLGWPGAAAQVPRLAELAVGAGADGLVCAPADVAALRERIGRRPILVTPGVRPASAGHDEHARATTPEEAIAAGSDVLVVGRPITRAADPLAAVDEVLAGVAAGRGRRR